MPACRLQLVASASSSLQPTGCQARALQTMELYVTGYDATQTIRYVAQGVGGRARKGMDTQRANRVMA